jgi:hypothetical protein
LPPLEAALFVWATAAIAARAAHSGATAKDLEAIIARGSAQTAALHAGALPVPRPEQGGQPSGLGAERGDIDAGSMQGGGLQAVLDESERDLAAGRSVPAET